MSTASRTLFEVDPKGLAKLLEEKGRGFAVMELVSNALDTRATRVDVTLRSVARGKVEVTVADDDPDGFHDLTHAYTLFAESERKSDPTTRGRFNLGEKLVIALCEAATVRTTSGSVLFGPEGRARSDAKREHGSEFVGLMRMTKVEQDEAIALMHRLIVPWGVELWVNGERVAEREFVARFELSLPTLIADEEGVLREVTRKAMVGIYEPQDGHKGTLYELGVPVVETGDRWDVNVWQKIPLNMERDNVRPSYLRQIRTAVLNETVERLTESEASAQWVGAALEDPKVAPEAVEAVITKRFGDKRVIADPSDREGTMIAASQGFTVIPAGSFNKRQWEQIREAGAALPAGRVTPSPSKGLNEADGGPLNMVPEDEWTAGERRMAEYARFLGTILLGFAPQVEVASSITYPAAATWGGGTLTFNRGRLGHRWFDTIGPEQDALILHEFAHNRVHNHLSAEYADEVARLAGLLVEAALERPEELRVYRSLAERVGA